MSGAIESLYALLSAIEHCKECKDHDTLYELSQHAFSKQYKLEVELLEYLHEQGYVKASIKLARIDGTCMMSFRYLVIASLSGYIPAKKEILANHREYLSVDDAFELASACNTSNAWIACGIIAARCDENDIVVGAFNRAIDLGDTNAHHLLGIHYAKNGNFELALKHWEIHIQDVHEQSLDRWDVPEYIAEYGAKRGLKSFAKRLLHLNPSIDNILTYGHHFVHRLYELQSVVFPEKVISAQIFYTLSLLRRKQMLAIFISVDDTSVYHYIIPAADLPAIIEFGPWFDLAGFKLKWYPEVVRRALFAFYMSLNRNRVNIPKGVRKLIASYILTVSGWKRLCERRKLFGLF